MSAKRLYVPNARSLAGLFLSAALVFAAAHTGKGRALGAEPAAATPARAWPMPPSPLQVRYQLDVPCRGEIFPALTTGVPSEYWPVAVLTIVNTSGRTVVETVSAEIHDWSRASTETVEIGPNETRAIRLNPELLPRAFENGEIRPATLEVRASVLGTTLGYDETRAVYLHSASDLYWGDKFSNAEFIARWVTPHDSAVLQLVSSARSYVPRGRLAGYHLASNLPSKSAPAVAAQVEDEARAVFQAMKDLGVSYVDSISTYGHFASQTERVRLPHETLSMNGANCIDLSVAFASAMENLGVQPVIVLIPGHAFTGVRLAPGSSEILYLDLTVLPDGTFQSAVARAQQWLEKIPQTQVNIIDITAARARQIYPMPQSVPQTAAPKA